MAIFAFVFKQIMAKASDLSNGSVIRYNGELVKVEEFIHRTPGNLRAFYQAKMRNVRTGKTVEYRFRTDEEVDLVRVETKNLQYLYKEGDNLICMDHETYDQVPVPGFMFGDQLKFMKEGSEVIVAFEQETPITAEGPNYVELEVTYCEPAIKGDTVNNVQKPCTLENGAEARVPMFVNQGDRIKIDTRTGAYIERVKA